MHRVNCISLIGEIQEMGKRPVDIYLREKNLKEIEIGVLQGLLLAPNQQLTMKELESRYGLSQPTVVGIISTLEKKGLVSTRMSEKDRRVKIVSITPAGDAAYNTALDDISGLQEHILRGFSQEERILFYDLLFRARRNINYDYKQLEQEVLRRMREADRKPTKI